MFRMISPIDIYVLLKVAAKGHMPWSQRDLSYELSISQSSVHQALKNAAEVKLFNPDRKRINRRGLEEALVHGARYFLFPSKGGEARGVLTAWAAQPLASVISANGNIPPVWPYPLGESRGFAVEPLHPSAPKAAMLDQNFYELLALLDAIRIGDSREQVLAARELHLRLEAA
jgi:hypothetical protein